MTFTRDATQQQFPKRNISDVPSYVGSITPMRDMSKFIQQAVTAASAGAVGKGINGAIKGFFSGNWIDSLGSIASGVAGLVATGTALLSSGETLNSAFKRSGLMTRPILFQFFPESISDSRAVNIGEVSMPLIPNPMPTTVSSSPRTISFEALFAQEKWAGEGQDIQLWDKHNFNVGIALQALRSFCYPMGTYTPLPQPLMLNLPGTRLGIDVAGIRGDTVFCVLKDYNAIRKSFFPDGSIRVASVQLSFQEFSVIGGGAGIGTTTIDDFADAYGSYTLYSDRALNNVGIKNYGVGKTKNPNSASDSEQ